METSLAFLKAAFLKAALLNSSLPKTKNGPNSPIEGGKVEESFKVVIEEVQVDLALLAQALNCTMRELASTLIVFVAAPEWLAAMQIGDGFLVTRAAGRQDFELVFPPEHSEYKNETSFVIDPQASALMKSCVRQWCHEFICASTDGVEHLAINYQNLSAHGPFFKPLADHLNVITDLNQANQDIERFLKSEKLNKRTDDDKTLLLCSWINNQAEEKEQ